MRNLQEYLTESEKTHEFRLKTIVELSEQQLDKLEKHLRKYDAFDISAPKRTILQSAPLDFANTDASEVFIIDFKTRLPLSPHMVMAELCHKLGINERNIRVRNILEPAETEDQKSMEDEDDKPKGALLHDDKYSEAESVNQADYHGELHKTKFLDDLEKNRKQHTTEYKGA
jgi:hypothetical protein